MKEQRFSSPVNLLLAVVVLSVTCNAYGQGILFQPSGWTAASIEQHVFRNLRIERQVFRNLNGGLQSQGSIEQTRQSLNEKLLLAIQEVQKVCTLSDDQIQKMRLAGRGDQARFFRRFEEVKTQILKNTNAPEELAPAVRELPTLRILLESGLYGEGSLFQKSQVNTLNHEQFLKYTEITTKRKQLYFESMIKLVAAAIERAAPLTEVRRKELFDLVRRETRLPRLSSRYDFYVIMIQLAKIDESELKQILNDAQWTLLKLQLSKMQRMERQLIGMGIIPPVDDAQDILLPKEPVRRLILLR